MPNWCENDVIVRGNPEDLEEFKRFIAGANGCFDFNKVFPYPEMYAEMDGEKREIYKLNGSAREKAEEAYKAKWHTDKDGYNTGGYEWCNNTWGTKWNACESDFEQHETYIIYRFDTAWGPPVRIYEELLKRFPKLGFNIKWYEAGECFKGGITARALKRGKPDGSRTYRKWSSNYRGSRGG
jgi:hypothetical protein